MHGITYTFSLVKKKALSLSQIDCLVGSSKALIFCKNGVSFRQILPETSCSGLSSRITDGFHDGV